MEKNAGVVNKIDTYIFVHDQEIILDFFSKNRFSDFENFKYVFLGNRPINKIENMSNVIISKNLKFNIEEYPKLTSFTGWYSLIKNNLINSEYVNLFEYDVNCIKNFDTINKKMIKNSYDFIGYFPMDILDPVYIKQEQYTKELISSIKTHTNYDVLKLLQNLTKSNSQTLWSSSSNSTWKVSELIKYIEWFEKFIDDIKDSVYCGHMHERSLSFFYFIYNLNVLNTQNLMTHYQLNTHGTSPLPPERFNQLYNNLK
jgi:hypothetical protein